MGKNLTRKILEAHLAKPIVITGVTDVKIELSI